MGRYPHPSFCRQCEDQEGESAEEEEEEDEATSTSLIIKIGTACLTDHGNFCRRGTERVGRA